MNIDRANVEHTVAASLLQWMTVHGYLCLALRHPGATGPSRNLAVDFVEQLGELLVNGGLLSRTELEEAQQLEFQERPYS